MHSERRKINMRGSRPLTPEEIDRVRRAFIGKMATRNAALFLLGVNTGFRISELLSLRLRDVLDDNGKLTDRLTVSKMNMKGRKSSRTVLFNTRAKRALTAWLKELEHQFIVNKDDYLFRSVRGRYAINRNHSWRELTKAYRVAEVRGKLGTHAMRKTFANRYYKYQKERLANGAPVDPFRSTSKALGHTDIRSTDQYLSFLVEEIDEAMEAIGV